MRLVIVQGPGEGQTFELAPGEYVAGREPEREIHLPSRRVSRKHCSFTVSGERCVVRDMGSANGLVINGHRMEACELVDGTQVQVGDVVLLFQAGASVQASVDRTVEQASEEPAQAFGGSEQPFGASDPAPFGDEAPFGANEPAFRVEEAAPDQAYNEPAAEAPPTARAPQEPSPSSESAAPSIFARLPWKMRLAGLLFVSSVIVFCGPLGGLASMAIGGGNKVHEMATEKGWALAEGLGHRNAIALSDRQPLLSDADIYEDDPFVKQAWVSDAVGKVVAPPEKVNRNLRTGTKTRDLWGLVERESRGVFEKTPEGYYAYMVPVKGSAPGSKTANLNVGYAYLVYDAAGAANAVGKPTWRLLFGLLWLGVAAAVTLIGVSRLAAAPLVAVRNETELAIKGDTARVECPSRWSELQDLVHSINRAIARRG